MVVSTSIDVIVMVLMEMQCSFSLFSNSFFVLSACFSYYVVLGSSTPLLKEGPLPFDWVIGLSHWFPDHFAVIEGI